VGKKIAAAITYILLSLYALACLYPFIWMVGTSLKTSMDALGNPASFIPAGALQFINYKTAWEGLNSGMSIMRSFFNSVAYSIVVPLFVIIIYSMMGFAVSTIKFTGHRAVFLMYVSLMLVPGMTVLIPLYIVLNGYGMVNSFLGLVLPAINGAGPFAVFLYNNYFHTISRELYESGEIDGASNIRIFTQIYFPIALPATGTVAVLNFIGPWNDLLWPTIILNDMKKFTLPLAIVYLNRSAFTQWQIIMAGSVISVLPVIFVFIFLQRFYIQGLTHGAIKG